MKANVSFLTKLINLCFYIMVLLVAVTDARGKGGKNKPSSGGGGGNE